MTSPRSKSPKPQNSYRKDDSKDETTFWDKIGTLGRKKRIKEGKYFNVTIYGHHYGFRPIKLKKKMKCLCLKNKCNTISLRL